MRSLIIFTLLLSPIIGSAFIKNGLVIDKNERPSIIRLSIAPFLAGKRPSFEQKKNWDSTSCSGTIISKRVILTAKHCVRSYPSSLNYENYQDLRIRLYIKGKLNQDMKIQGVYKVPFGKFNSDGSMDRIYSRFDIAAIILTPQSAQYISDDLITDLSLCKVHIGDYSSMTGFGFTESIWQNFKLLLNSSTKTFTEFNMAINNKSNLYVMTKDNSGSSFDPNKYQFQEGSNSMSGDSGAAIMNKYDQLIAIHNGKNEEKTHSFSAPLRVIKNIEFLTRLIDQDLINKEKIACYAKVKDTKTTYYGIIE